MEKERYELDNETCAKLALLYASANTSISTYKNFMKLDDISYLHQAF